MQNAMLFFPLNLPHPYRHQKLRHSSIPKFLEKEKEALIFAYWPEITNIIIPIIVKLFHKKPTTRYDGLIIEILTFFKTTKNELHV